MNAVLEDRGSILRDGHLKLGGEGSRFLEIISVRKHLPAAANRFVHFDGDRRVLVVAESDFIFHLPGLVVDALVVDLFALGNDIEGIADVNADASLGLWRA